MIRPHFWASMWVTTARAMKNWPLKLMATTLLHASGEVSQKLVRAAGPKPRTRGLVPALFTRMCTPPSSATVLPTALSASSGLEISATTVMTQSSPPVSRISLAVCSSQVSLMSIIATLAPAPTRATVMARPIPMGLPAPVTMATFPSSGFSCMTFLPV